MNEGSDEMTAAAVASPTVEEAPTRQSVWRHRSFVRLWVGQSAGSVSDQLMPVALSLYVVDRGGGAGAVGLVLGGRAAALVICLLAGGVLADRVRRVPLLITADVFRAAVLLVAVAFL